MSSREAGGGEARQRCGRGGEVFWKPGKACLGAGGGLSSAGSCGLVDVCFVAPDLASHRPSYGVAIGRA